MKGAPADDTDLSAETFAPHALTRSATIGRRTPKGDVVELMVEYAVVDGKAIYQGDIRLGDADAIASRERERSLFGLVVTPAGHKWPGGRMPYAADAGNREIVEKAAAYIAARTAVRIVPKTDADRDFVRVLTSGTNDSAVGRTGGEQILNLTANCSLGTAIHELCHALGLWHEQCRPDRDRHITVVTANVRPGFMPQFAIQDTDAAIVGPYDYRSIMHYGPHGFAWPRDAVTIRTKSGESIGQRDGLSPGDVASLMDLYP